MGKLTISVHSNSVFQGIANNQFEIMYALCFLWCNTVTPDILYKWCDRYITIIFQSTSYEASYLATYLLAPIWFLRAFQILLYHELSL